MKKIKTAFEETFGIPLPQQMVFDGDLTPLDLSLTPYSKSKADEALMLVSEAGLEFKPPVAMSLLNSFFSAPEGYYFIGFYDSGINNFGFFYAEVDAWRRVYFRLNYDGVYTDGDRERKNIREFLPKYFEFEQRLKGKVKRLEVFEAVGNSKYTIILPDGHTIEKDFSFREYLLGNPNFENKFSDVLQML